MIKLLFFKDCPTHAILKDLLKKEGVEGVKEIDLEELPENDPYRSYSSPTLLLMDQIIVGTRTSNTAMSCTRLAREEMLQAVKKLISSSHVGQNSPS